MKIERVGDALIEIDGVVRIEPGPLRKRAVATKELLSDDVTASHYFEGERQVGVQKVRQLNDEGQSVVVDKPVMKTGVDSMGKPIKLGKEMDYIDWKNRARVFYVYVLDDAGKWQHDTDGPFQTEEAAISRGATIVAEKGA